MLCSDTSPNLQQSNVQSISERDFLRSEGDPAGMGYTLKEAADLVRSTVSEAESETELRSYNWNSDHQHILVL